MPRITIRSDRPRAHSPRRETVLCTGCNQFVHRTGRCWKPISQLCLSCDTKKNDAARLTIRVPPRRRLCTLCRQVHAVLDLEHPNRPTRSVVPTAGTVLSLFPAQKD